MPPSQGWVNVIVQPKGLFGVYPCSGNILIELPTLPVCISLTSAHGSGFCCVPACWSIFSPLLALRFSQAHPHNASGVWPMGATWPRRSIHPSLPPEPFPRAARRRLESKGNISVVASGCSWLPPFPQILGARAPLGLPQLLVTPCLQLSSPPELPGLFPRELIQGQTLRNLFSRLCALVGDICCVVLGVHGVPSPVGSWVSPSSPATSSAHGAAGDNAVRGEMCPPRGAYPVQNLLENPAKGVLPCSEAVTLPWGGVWVEASVESNMAREEG